MRDFLHWQRDNNGWQTRMVWLDGISCGGVNKSEKNEVADLELKNPLKFSTRELRAMEDDSKNLSPEQKKDFRDIAGYFLSIKQKSGTKNLPPHMLVQIEQSPLFSLLSKKMQEQIKNVLDSQIEELIGFSKKSLTTPSMAIRASLLYRRLRSRVHDDPRLKIVFNDVQENLLGWALDVLKSGSISEQVKDTLSGNNTNRGAIKKITKQEKLIIASIYRMFPNSKDWVDYCDGASARTFAKEAMAAIKENPEDPTMVLGWGFIDEWMAAGDMEMIEDLTSTFSPEELAKFIGRARSVELLQFAREQSPFLPVHLHALNELKNNPDYLPTKYSETEWAELAPEEIAKDAINKELRELKEKYDLVKDEEVARHKENKPDAPEVLQYLEAKQKREDAINTCWEEQLSQVEELVSRWDNIVKFEVQAAEARQKVLDGQLDLNDDERDLERKQKYQEDQDVYIENYKIQLEEALPLFKTIQEKYEAGESSLEEKESTIQEFQDLLKEKLPNTSNYGVTATPEEDIPLLKEVNIGLKKYEEELEKQEKEAESAINKMPFSEDFESQKKEYEEKKAELKKSQETFVKELKERDEWNEIFSDPQKYAREAHEKFWSGIQKRLNDRQLNAVDFDVLWNEDFAEDIQEYISNRPEQEKIQKFRQAFEGALVGVFDELSFPDDRYELWYTDLDKQLSYENLIERLQQQGFDIQNEFQKPQQLSELLEGAIMHYRELIFSQVKGKISGDKQNEFYSNWDRLHGRLSPATQDPTVVAAEHSKYESEKLDTVKRIQAEQERNVAIIEALRKRGEEKPEMADHYNSEADKLEQAWEVRKKWYGDGGKMTIEMQSGEKKTIWAPGKNILTEMAFQGKSVEKEIQKVLDEGVKVKVFEIAEGYKELNDLESNVEKKSKLKGLKSKLDSIFAQWPQIKNRLKQLLKDHTTILEELLPKDSELAKEFVKNISETTEGWLLEIEKGINSFQRNSKKNEYKYYGDEEIFSLLPKAIQALSNTINFNDGKFAENSKNLDVHLEQDTETVKFLDKGEFFTDTSEDKEDFRGKYEEMRSEFASNFSSYRANFISVKSKLEKDMNRLSEEEFTERHGGMDPMHMKEMIESHDNQLDVFENGSKKFLSPSFFKNWLKNYNKSPESRVTALGEMSQFRGFTDWSHEAKNQAESMARWIEDWDKNKMGSVKKYQKFSIHDLYSLVKQTIEVHSRRWERKSEQAIANIGVSFFGRTSPWGKEFHRKSQETEEARVKEIETEMDEDPWWETQETLYTTNDQDEAKACIRLLIEKGVFRWDDPKLWKTFMRLSHNAVFFNDNDINLELSQILEKCRDVCEFIWSRETFRQWDTSLESKIKSKEDEFTADFQRFEYDPKARGIILQNMLRNWANNKRENTDPAKYGLFLRKAFELGKLNGGPMFDSRWYFLIMGVKHGILSRDFLGRLNGDLLANMPYFDFFIDKSGYKKDGRFVPKGTPGAERRGWIYEDYEAWADMLDSGTSGNFSVEDARTNVQEFFYEYVLQSEESRARLERMVRNGTKSFDHDDAALFAAGLTMESVTKMLNTTSTDEDKYTPDFWRNVMAGYVPYFNGISKYIRKGDAEYGKDNPEWAKIRERNFVEVADRMKAMTILFHSVLGNINLNERKPIIFQTSDFNKHEQYSPCARGSFEATNKVLDKLLDVSGRTEFKSIYQNENEWLVKNGQTAEAKEAKNSENLKAVKRGEKEANVSTKIYDLTKAEASQEVFSSRNIEKMLTDESFDWKDLMDSFKGKVY